MKKRVYRQKRKVDYMNECGALKQEVVRLQAQVADNHKLRLQGRLDAFDYALVEIEISESLESAMSRIRSVIAETKVDLKAIGGASE